MSILSQLFSPLLIEALSLTLVHFIWQGLAVALILKLALYHIPIRHEIARYYAALTAMLVNLLLPVATFFLIYSGENSRSTLFSTPQHQPAFDQAMPSAEYLSQLNGLVNIGWFAALWLVGVCYLTLRLLYQVHQANRLTHVAVFHPSEELATHFISLHSQLTVRQPVQLLMSFKAEVPMVVGWIKPVILLPISMVNGLSQAQLEMLLVHELAHVKRHDYLVNLIQTLVEILLFYHPCVKWVSQQVRIEREYCCDECAIHHCGDSKAYVSALVKAESLRRQTIPQLALAATGGDLKLRVQRVVDKKLGKNEDQCIRTEVSRFWAGISSALLVSALVLTMSHNQRLPQSAGDIYHQVQNKIKLQTQLNGRSQQTIADPIQMASSLPASVNTEHQPQDDTSPNGVVVWDNSVNATVMEPAEPVARPAINRLDNIMKAKTIDLAATEAATQLLVEQMQIRLTELQKLELENNITQGETKLITHIQPEVIKDLDEQTEDKQLPTLIRAVMPDYPRSALKYGDEIDVAFTFVVTEKGRVKDIQFTSEVLPAYEKAVVKSMRKWRFRAGEINGEKQPMALSKVFSFKNSGRGSRFDSVTTGSRIAKLSRRR